MGRFYCIYCTNLLRYHLFLFQRLQHSLCHLSTKCVSDKNVYLTKICIWQKMWYIIYQITFLLKKQCVIISVFVLNYFSWLINVITLILIFFYFQTFILCILSDFDHNFFIYLSYMVYTSSSNYTTINLTKYWIENEHDNTAQINKYIYI
jgi:hypothetical protein